MMLTVRDKIILLILAIMLCSYGAYRFLWIPAGNTIVQLEEKKQSVEGLAGDISPLLEKSQSLKEQEKELKESVQNIKQLSGGYTTTNEEFLVLLGDSSKKNNVAVTGFTDLGTTSEDGIYRNVFDFELRGNSVDINKVLEDINNMGIKCSFGSISFRQNEQYDYLKRFFDDMSDLPWYKEPEEEEQPEVVPDVDIQLPENTYPDENEIPKPPSIPNEEPSNTPVPETPKTIEERLNSLLENVSYSNAKSPNYSVVFLTNTTKAPATYKAGQEMRLAVTVCFVMYNEPSAETSFLLNMEGASDGIL